MAKKEEETIIEPIIPEEGQDPELLRCCVCQQQPAEYKMTRYGDPKANGLLMISRYCDVCIIGQYTKLYADDIVYPR